MNCNYFLTTTSALFLIPCYYGYKKSKYSLSCVSLITSACSMNYWRNPVNGWRLLLDRITATSCGVIYFWYGYNKINNSKIRLLGYFNGGLILLSYVGSEMLYQQSSNYWIYSHIMFHMCKITGELLTLHYSS